MSEMSHKTRPSNHKPSYEKWLILVSASITSMINSGFLFTINKYFVDIRELFNSSRAETAAINSTAVGSALSLGIVYGLVVSRIGVRRSSLIATFFVCLGLGTSYFATSVSYLIVSLGMVTASGVGCIMVSTSAILVQHFRGPWAATATAVLATANGVGSLVYPFLVDFLIDKFSVRGAFLIIAGMMTHGFPAAILWVPSDNSNQQPMVLSAVQGTDNLRVITVATPGATVAPELGDTVIQMQYPGNDRRIKESLKQNIISEVKANPTRRFSAIIIEEPAIKEHKTGNGVILKLLKDKVYVLYAISISVVQPATAVVLFFIVDYFLDRGLTKADSSLGLLVFSSTNIFGRILTGFLAQKASYPVFLPLILASCLVIASVIGFSFTSSMVVILVFCSVNGLAFGIVVASFVVVTQSIVEASEFANAVGMAYSFTGLLNLTTGPIIGYLRDTFGSYQVPFLSSLALAVPAFLMLCLAQTFHLSHQREGVRSASIAFTSKL